MKSHPFFSSISALIYVILIPFKQSQSKRKIQHSIEFLKWLTKNRLFEASISTVSPSTSFDVEMNSPHFKLLWMCPGPKFHLKPFVVMHSVTPKGINPQKLFYSPEEMTISCLMFFFKKYIRLV